MLELRIKQGRRHLPLSDLPAVLGRAEAAQEVGDAIEGLIAFLDDLGGDPDDENGHDLEDDFELSASALAAEGSQPGCSISDADYGVDDTGEGIDEREPEEASDEFSDPAIRASHRRRLQRTRCYPIYRYIRDWKTGEVTRREVQRYALTHDTVVPVRRALLWRKRGMPRRPRA